MYRIRCAQRHDDSDQLHQPCAVRQNGRSPRVSAHDPRQRKGAVRRCAGLEAGSLLARPIRQRTLQTDSEEERRPRDLRQGEHLRRAGGHHSGIHAEYYSAELSEKIQRGQKENALKCRSNGGNIPLGYVVGPEGVLQADSATAPLVREIFTRYESGETLKAIADSLNKRGLLTRKGSSFRIATLSVILKNRKYIGEYKYADTVIPDGIPAIIEPDLFERVQQRMEGNKKAPSRTKADEEYLLTTKLFCGDCGRLMVGESGTSGTNGAKYCYYK